MEGLASLSLALRAKGFAIQPLDWDEAEQASRLPLHRKEPMDRMPIATAPRHDLAILTSDGIFAVYGVTAIR